VIDEVGDYTQLDAHYNEFNIALSDEERNELTYRIIAPYNGQYYYYSRGISGIPEVTTGMNEELYNWIKFKPTTDENTLAKYDGGKDLWSFDDMCTPTVKTNPAAPDKDGKKWYTVFIDEYVYHFDDEGSVETSWPNYVNQDDRMAEFIFTHHVSKDQESSYSYCRYAFAQRSIQTYYKGISAHETALGIEHIEETYCLNMDWVFASPNGYSDEHKGGRLDHDNGRYNLYNYLDSIDARNREALSDEERRQPWSKYIQETVPCDVPKGSNGGCSHEAKRYNVYMPVVDNHRTIDNRASSDNNTYHANTICMNRNRDLDGNDFISNDELKWYLPTSAAYIQIAIAQEELPSPFMRFTDYDRTYFTSLNGDDRYGTYNFHYITSDYQYYWAEQFVNVGDNPYDGYSPGPSQAYTARCVRNLGTDPSKRAVKWQDDIEYAFEYDANTRTFTQDEYTDNTLRGYNYGGIAPHDFSQPSSRPYKKFQYAKQICKNLSDSYISFDGNGYLNFKNSANDWYNKTKYWTLSLERNGICGQYYEASDKSDLGEWRIPTASEMAMMWIEKIPQNSNAIDGISGDNYFMSGTYDYFKTYNLRNCSDYYHTYLGYNDYWDRKVPALDVWDHSGQIRLRCVRDVR
jgi:hypothetical protein